MIVGGAITHVYMPQGDMMLDIIFKAAFGALMIYGIWRFLRGLGSRANGDGPGESAVIPPSSESDFNSPH
jgi:hypothetical protein